MADVALTKLVTRAVTVYVVSNNILAEATVNDECVASKNTALANRLCVVAHVYDAVRPPSPVDVVVMLKLSH